MTDKEFFDLLDLSGKGYEPIRLAVESDDLQMARRAFAIHLRQRKVPRWEDNWTPLPRGDTPEARQLIMDAEKVVLHRFSSVGIEHHFDHEIDWSYNPTTQPNSPHAVDHEWTWQLNRHWMWLTLARAYRLTGDERYTREFAAQLTGWVAQNPVPVDEADQKPFSRWRTIEAGIRMYWTWPNLLFTFRKSPEFTDDALLTLIKSMAEHGRYLQAYPTTGNWLAMEMNGLFHVAMLLPELREAGKWARFAFETLKRELEIQVYPDGAQIELSPGYHNVSLKNFLAPVLLLKNNEHLFPASYRERLAGYVALLERMYDFDLFALLPDRSLPPFNDSWHVDVPGLLAGAHELFPQRQDYQWIATEGAQGEPPDHLSHAFPYAGYLIMRSGWDRDARYLAFDAGPFGYGHQHEDKLTFMLSAYGANMVVDAGSYAYDRSRWRKYVLSARGHNVIHVDGLEQHRRGYPREEYVVESPLPHVWKTTDEFDYAEGYFGGEREGFGPGRTVRVRHARQILFVRSALGEGDDYWLVVDSLEPEDERVHSYESTFHIDMDRVELATTSGGLRGRNEGGPGLAIVSVAGSTLGCEIVSKQEEPVVQGWMPLQHGRRGVRPLPTVCYRQRTTGPAMFAYVFYPVPAGKEAPVKALRSLPLENADGEAVAGWRFEITFADGRRHQVALSREKGAAVQLGGLSTNARVAISVKGEDGDERVVEVLQ